MQAIDSDDMDAIQALRTHRNAVAHDLVNQLHVLRVENYAPLLERAARALLKLSSYRAYMEVGAEPEPPSDHLSGARDARRATTLLPYLYFPCRLSQLRLRRHWIGSIAQA